MECRTTDSLPALLRLPLQFDCKGSPHRIQFRQSFYQNCQFLFCVLRQCFRCGCHVRTVSDIFITVGTHLQLVFHFIDFSDDVRQSRGEKGGIVLFYARQFIFPVADGGRFGQKIRQQSKGCSYRFSFGSCLSADGRDSRQHNGTIAYFGKIFQFDNRLIDLVLLRQFKESAVLISNGRGQWGLFTEGRLMPQRLLLCQCGKGMDVFLG